MNSINHFNFKSNKKNNFFAPEWDAHIFEKQTNINNKTLLNFLKKNKKNILDLPLTIKENKFSDGYTGLGKNSTTARFEHYNLFDSKCDEIIKLKKEIILMHNEICKFLNLKIPKKIYAKCWVNFLSKNKKIKPHSHSTTPDCYLGGHFCVSVKNTKTIYINPINQINDPIVFESNNLNGKLTLFSNYIPHYTTKNENDEERITLAFDLSLVKTNNVQIELESENIL